MTGEIAFGILLAHLFGDYLIQSYWMANEKTKPRWPVRRTRIRPPQSQVTAAALMARWIVLSAMIISQTVSHAGRSWW